MKKVSRAQNKLFNLPKFFPVIAFVVILAVVAGSWRLYSSKAYTGHHAECTYFSVSTNTIKKGASFTSKVTMRNDGSTTWSPTYAFYLGTIGSTDWHLSGGAVSSNVSPGQSKSFNLTAQAPSAGGTYGFQPAMAIVYQSAVKNYCNSKTITVANTPSISITSPTSGSRVSNSVTIKANAGNNIPINKVDFYINGKLIASDTGSPYVATWNTKSYANGSYSLTAKVSDSLNQTRTSGTVKATVSNSSSTGQTPSAGPPPVSNSPGRGGAVDGKAPTSPADFQAVADDTTKSVGLSWSASQDNVGVTKYELQRSENNQKKWTTLSGKISPDRTSYNDISVGFGKTLYYRIRAFDDAGNSSAFALTQVNTSDFSANSSTQQDTTISSDDQVVSIIIPANTLSDDAFCAITVSTDVLPPNNGLVTVNGPYELTCRNKDGNIIDNLGSGLVLSARINSGSLKGLGTPEYFGQTSDGKWQKLEITGHDRKSSIDTVDLQGLKVFNIMAAKKTTPLILKIFIFIVVIGLMILILRLANRFLLKRKAEAEYEDYLRKSKGL